MELKKKIINAPVNISYESIFWTFDDANDDDNDKFPKWDVHKAMVLLQLPAFHR